MASSGGTNSIPAPVVPVVVVGLVVSLPVLVLLVELDLVLPPPVPVVVLELPVDFVLEVRLVLPPDAVDLEEEELLEVRVLLEPAPPDAVAFDLLELDEAPPTLELPFDFGLELELSVVSDEVLSLSSALVVVGLRVLEVLPPALVVAAFPPLPSSLGAASIGLLSTSPSLLLQAALSSNMQGIDSAHNALLRSIIICYLSRH